MSHSVNDRFSSVDRLSASRTAPSLAPTDASTISTATVHVLDSSAPNLDEHRSAVLQVLQQIGVPEEKTKNMIEVWNKIDIQDEGMDIRINEYIGEDDDDEGDGDDCIDDAEADSEMEGEDSSVSSDPLPDEGEDADDQPLEEEMNAYNDDGEDSLAEPLMSIEEAMDEQIGDIPGEDIVEELLSAEEDAIHALMGADSQEWIRQSGETEDEGDSDATSLKSDDDPGTTLSHEWDAGGPHPRPETTPHVKTSAVTRVGLLELLELIDEKLRTKSDAGKQSSSHFEEGAGAAASASSR
uniref:Uncharacterized protein n=1 Tax=Kalanchoe fedtschenkoi TaxID=63787 RepID=A0A7N0VDC7_KALFE